MTGSALSPDGVLILVILLLLVAPVSASAFHDNDDLSISGAGFEDCADLTNLPRALVAKEVAQRGLRCWQTSKIGGSDCREDDYGKCGKPGDTLKIDSEGWARWTISQGSYMPEGDK